ncbi:hypothetical protein K435DRAFT_817177 [Dendrothele bispora CBS 962.96]|uniref:Uncharacterized protein n=1 Tax=Dendrothele bispora (strain CBS 962.96) TaxID=1314807 RepID=A0A4S8MLG6_DENBC|nr:hypothetical protein K435DRAFT_817177 [Dendrothele bispora CBS 962.96]
MASNWVKMVDNHSPTAVNDHNPNQLEYPIRESAAYLMLWSNIKNPMSTGVGSEKTSKELWDHLEKDHTVTGPGGHAEKFRGLYKEAVDAGAKIDDVQMLTIFIDSFPQGPEIRMSDDTVVGGDKILAMQAEINELKERIVAMQATCKTTVNPDLKCSNPNCKGIGHMIKNCFKLGGGKQGKYPKWWKRKQDASLPNAPNTMLTESSDNNPSANSMVAPPPPPNQEHT